MKRSIRAQAAILAAAVMAVAGVVLCAVFVQGARHEMVAEAVRDGVRASTSVLERINHGRSLDLRLREYRSFAQIVDDSGRVLAASPELRGKAPFSGVPGRGRPTAQTRTFELAPSAFHPASALEVDAQRIPFAGRTVSLYTFSPVPPPYISGPLVAALAVWTALVAAVSGAIVWWWMGRRLRGVEAIRRDLAEITVTDLSRRVPEGGRDEVGRLATTVNETLDRLEEAVEQQRRFTADVSHDLRTPIAAMQLELEDALDHPEDVDWVTSGEAMRAGLTRLHAIVADLLHLARLDAEDGGAREAVELSALVRRELASRQRRVEVRRVLSEAVVDGDDVQLARLLNNLLDNAERHARSVITVMVGQQDGQAVLTVSDDGIGIAPEDRERIFQRFVRLAASRSRDRSGTGLGLPIARRIAHAHGGTLEVAEQGPGACFVLRLPADPADQTSTGSSFPERTS
ncbi:sensor histidine kinase [Nonomuraea sp. NPDC050663]|uniref:sensor histidine kinase n=1 Tax=Nonomuraea sp. NPDC050663 TaxID=3364370 RepID=UPI00379C039D